MIRFLLPCAVAVSLLVGGPAQAVTYDRDDAVGDVRLSATSGDREFTRAQMERAADITQLRIRHGKARLILRLETVALSRRSGQVIGPSFLIRAGERRWVSYTAAFSERGRTSRFAFLTRLNAAAPGPRCRGLFTDFDFTANVSLVSIPRSCLGDPRSVTVKAVMSRQTDEGRRFRGWFDSAMDDRRLRPISATPSLRSGPRQAV